MLLHSLIKQNLVFLHLFFMPMIFTVAVQAQDTIPYKVITDGKLKWSDYTGEVDKYSTYWATTYWNVHYKYKIVQFHHDTVTIDLQVWPALQENSWALPDKETTELLQHEQGHYDFALLLTLEFKKEADSTTLLMNNYNRKLDSIFNATLNNIQQMEIQYDNETNHMWNRPAQKRWNDKIADMLKAAE